MTGVITHAEVTGGAADPNAVIDGPAWDANHTITGAWSPSQGGTGVANSDSSTLTISGSFGLTFTISAATSITLPTTGTLASLSNKLSDFAATTSAELKTVISDETGSGALVFATSPTLVTPALGTPSSGVVTNLTGTASININGTVGATTPNTGAFTSLAYSTTLTGTSANASALAVGPNGATNPSLQVDASTASAATGPKIKSAAAASGLALSVITSGTNEALTVDAAGTGPITLGGTSTGDIRLGRNTNVSSTATAVAADALLTLNDNTAASVAISGSLTPQIHIVGADGGNSGIAAHAYGNKVRLEVYQSGGTQASKTATSVANGDIFGFNAYGWDTSAYNIGAQFTFTPSETWSGTARGTHIRFVTTAPTTTTLSEKMRIHGSGGVVVGSAFATDPGAGHIRATAAMATKAPSTFTGTSGTVGNDDSAAIFNPSGSFTATLPTASSYPGRWLYVKTIAAQTVASASSNVIPRAGGAAGTAILAAAAGNWALLQSNATNWEIMAGS